MSEERVFVDEFSKTFAEQEEFFEFIKSIGRNSKWSRNKSRLLRVVAIEKDSTIANDLREQYAASGLDQEIIDDTIKNTGLVLKAKGQYVPIRDCAIGTILDRAGISGPALRKLEKSVYARIMNDCLKVAKGEALIRVSEGKVSAVLGGDSHDYSIIDMEYIFMRSVEFLNKRFKKCEYLAGFYEHSKASSMWALTGEDKLLATYREELTLHGKEPEEMTPVIRITTSDTGDSGVNIYPMLLSGARSDTINLGDPLRLSHIRGANLNEFEENLKMLYGKYQTAINGLSNLLNIAIYHPVNCMISVMKRLKIPQKYCLEAAELFQNQYGNDPCTAHDIYFGISEILYMLACNGECGSKIIKMEENIARALSINWEDYDLPSIKCK